MNDNDNNDLNDIEFLNLDDDAAASAADNDTHKVRSASGSASHSSSSRAKRRRRRRRKILIQRLVFLAALIVFIVSGVILANTLLNYHKANVIYQDIEDAVFSADSSASGNQNQEDAVLSGITGETVDQTVLLTNYDHEALLALNPDAVGYLQIPAINLLLPVVQGSDNSYYLNHAINGTQSSNGTLFIDCGNDEGIESKNAIIYGHNMKNGSMFGSLKKFGSEEFFNSGDNRYFYFYTGTMIYKYEIYSVHTTPAVSETYTTKFASRDAFFTYIDSMIRASYYSCNLDFYEDSKTITFSTCTNDDATRLVVQGLRIDEISTR
jgi:sortase B